MSVDKRIATGRKSCVFRWRPHPSRRAGSISERVRSMIDASGDCVVSSVSSGVDRLNMNRARTLLSASCFVLGIDVEQLKLDEEGVELRVLLPLYMSPRCMAKVLKSKVESTLVKELRNQGKFFYPLWDSPVEVEVVPFYRT